MVLHSPQQHLKSSRGGKPASRQHAGTDTGVKAGGLYAARGKTRRHTANQRCSASSFRFLRFQNIQTDLAHGVAFRQQTNLSVPTRTYRGNRLQVDGRSQNHTALVVGMVSAEFRPPRRGKQECRNPAEHLGKAAFQVFIHFDVTPIPRLILHKRIPQRYGRVKRHPSGNTALVIKCPL